MSLFIVFGKPGAGKSYWAMRWLARELTTRNRIIWTNLSVDMGALADLMAKRHPEWPGRMWDTYDDVGNFVPARIQFLTDQQLQEFYRWRMPGAEPVSRIGTEEQDKKKGAQEPIMLDFSKPGPGVVYLLDEVQLFYNVRRFALVPREFGYYLSQHRKLGDDVVAITQQPANLDRMFQSYAEQYISLHNMAKRKMGPFRFPAYFEARAYSFRPTGSPGDFAEATIAYRLDKELANCYLTQQGIGVAGEHADKGERAKGISMLWLLLLFPLIFAFFGGMVGGMRKLLLPGHGFVPSPAISRATNGIALSARSPISKTSAANDNPPQATSAPSNRATPPPSRSESKLLLPDGARSVRWSEEIVVDGYGIDRNIVEIWLSDGSHYWLGDGHFTTWEANTAIVDGVAYRFLNLRERLAWERRRDAQAQQFQRESVPERSFPVNQRRDY